MRLRVNIVIDLEGHVYLACKMNKRDKINHDVAEDLYKVVIESMYSKSKSYEDEYL